MKTVMTLLALFLSHIICLAGCTTSPIAKPPRLNLTNIQVEKPGLIEQEFLLTLKVQNPNTVALDVKGMTFDLEINDQHFAGGVSAQPVFVAAYGTETFGNVVSSSLGGLLGQFDALVKKGNIDIYSQTTWKCRWFEYINRREEIEWISRHSSIQTKWRNSTIPEII